MALILIAIGFFYLIYGEKYFKFNAVLLVSVSVGFILYSIMGHILPVHFSAYFVVGLIVGILFVQIKEVVMTAAGTIIGFVGGNIVYNLTLKFHNFDQDITYWVIIFSFVVISVVITNYIEQFVFIIATSIIGSYLIVRVIIIK